MAELDVSYPLLAETNLQSVGAYIGTLSFHTGSTVSENQLMVEAHLWQTIIISKINSSYDQGKSPC